MDKPEGCLADHKVTADDAREIINSVRGFMLCLLAFLACFWLLFGLTAPHDLERRVEVLERAVTPASVGH